MPFKTITGYEPYPHQIATYEALQRIKGRITPSEDKGSDISRLSRFLPLSHFSADQEFRSPLSGFSLIDSSFIKAHNIKLEYD